MLKNKFDIKLYRSKGLKKNYKTFLSKNIKFLKQRDNENIRGLMFTFFINEP